MTTITQADIASAKDSESAKGALCATVAANLAESNPGWDFRSNGAGVFRLVDGRVLLVCSWTLFGTFIACPRAFDVTAYVDVRELVAAGVRPADVSRN